MAICRKKYCASQSSMSRVEPASAKRHACIRRQRAYAPRYTLKPSCVRLIQLIRSDWSGCPTRAGVSSAASSRSNSAVPGRSSHGLRAARCCKKWTQRVRETMDEGDCDLERGTSNWVPNQCQVVKVYDAKVTELEQKMEMQKQEFQQHIARLQLASWLMRSTSSLTRAANALGGDSLGKSKSHSREIAIYKQVSQMLVHIEFIVARLQKLALLKQELQQQRAKSLKKQRWAFWQQLP